MTENIIIFNTRVVTPLGFSARCGKEMEQLSIIDNATVEVTDGIITYVGPNRGEERDGYYQRYWHYNARGKCLLPGFVDSHTHFVFGGERAEEFSWRLRGESYMSIMERGGGIVSTVKATRACNFIQLRSKAESFLKQMGCTVVVLSKCTVLFVNLQSHLVADFNHTLCNLSYMAEFAACKLHNIFYDKFTVFGTDDTFIGFLSTHCCIEWSLGNDDRSLISVCQCIYNFCLACHSCHIRFNL